MDDTNIETQTTLLNPKRPESISPSTSQSPQSFKEETKSWEAIWKLHPILENSLPSHKATGFQWWRALSKYIKNDDLVSFQSLVSLVHLIPHELDPQLIFLTQKSLIAHISSAAKASTPAKPFDFAPYLDALFENWPKSETLLPIKNSKTHLKYASYIVKDLEYVYNTHPQFIPILLDHIIAPDHSKPRTSRFSSDVPSGPLFHRNKDTSAAIVLFILSVIFTWGPLFGTIFCIYDSFLGNTSSLYYLFLTILLLIVGFLLSVFTDGMGMNQVEKILFGFYFIPLMITNIKS